MVTHFHFLSAQLQAKAKLLNTSLGMVLIIGLTDNKKRINISTKSGIVAVVYFPRVNCNHMYNYFCEEEYFVNLLENTWKIMKNS